MLLGPILAIPSLTLQGKRVSDGNKNGKFNSASSKLSSKNNNFSYNLGLSSKKGKKFVASSSKEQGFVPFEEVQKEAFVVPLDPKLSLSRQCYSDACEAAINEQIKYASLAF